MEKQLKTLSMENARLSTENKDLRATLKQLVTENAHENIDQRRVNLLKMQIIQLERQVLILHDAIGSRTESILELENMLVQMSDKLRSIIADKSINEIVTLPKSDVQSLLENVESSRLSIARGAKQSFKQNVGKGLLLLNPFLKKTTCEATELTTLDISLQRNQLLNLQHVSQLEAKLLSVYKDITCLYEELQLLSNPNKVSWLQQKHLTGLYNERLDVLLVTTTARLRDVLDDLLALSILCPTSTAHSTNIPASTEIPISRIVSALPPMASSKQREVEEIVGTSLAVTNHKLLLLEQENSALRETVSFHNSIYDLQMEYINSFLQVMRVGYEDFEKSAKSVLADPVQEILSSYQKLKQSTSEDSLRTFLLDFRQHEAKLKNIVEMLSQSDTDSSVFSLFGEDFLSKVSLAVNECQKRRDEILETKEDLRKIQERSERELQQLVQKSEVKYKKQWIYPKSKSQTSSESFMKLNYSTDSNQTEEKTITTWESQSDVVDKCFPKSKSRVNNSLSSDIAEPRSLNKSYVDKTKQGRNKPWKPVKEWVNDFTSDSFADVSSTSSLQTSSESSKVSPIDANTDAAKNVKSYKPKLSTAKRTLRLKPSSGQSDSNAK